MGSVGKQTVNITVVHVCVAVVHSSCVAVCKSSACVIVY